MTDPAKNIAFSSLTGVNRMTLNGPLRGARNNTCRTLIGLPRGTFDDNCRPVTSPAFEALVQRSVDVGPFAVTGLRPAVEALSTIFAEVKADHPAVHSRLVTAGMLCCRLVRGSKTAISNHAFGIAIDIGVDSIDIRNDNKAQQGLLDIHPIFNRHGFFWGASFPTEDAMHFEASEQLVRKWAADGQFGPGPVKPLTAGLTMGDRGAAVLALQQALNAHLPLQIDEDGIFGPDTRGAVMELQRQRGLGVTGIAGKTVLQALGLAP
ncbi:MAG: peptidoglycan-binding protein [Gemmobacter sp.]